MSVEVRNATNGRDQKVKVLHGADSGVSESVNRWIKEEKPQIIRIDVRVVVPHLPGENTLQLTITYEPCSAENEKSEF